MKSKKYSEHIIKVFKKDGFVLSEPDVFLDSDYIIQRSGENFRKLMLTFEDDTGKNIFATKNRYGNDFLKYAISGFQETFYDSFPIFIPNVNGFRRIQTRNFVPVNKSWSWNRRDVSLRIPAGSDSSKRIEHRVASADANPYLVLACILAGLHYGLTKKQMPTN